jgi:hypothetical protein
MTEFSRPPIPAPPYHGGCLCGAVRYRIDAPPLSINACHCVDCKKLTGVTHLVMFLTKRDQLTKEQGETETFRKPADSGRQVDVVRCAACGTRLWHEPVGSTEFTLVAVGTLDDPSWAIPTTHIWIERAEKHITFAPDALLVEGQPPDRTGAIAAFKRIYG